LALASVAAAKGQGKSNQQATPSGLFLGYGVHCFGCNAMAIYPTHEAAMAHTLTHFSEYDKLVPEGRIRFVGLGKFEHKCTDFPVDSRLDNGAR